MTSRLFASRPLNGKPKTGKPPRPVSSEDRRPHRPPLLTPLLKSSRLSDTVNPPLDPSIDEGCGPLFIGNMSMPAQPHPQDRTASHRLYAYRLSEGWQVLAGRTDADNDHLSLRVAAPNDWWFHVRGQPGSHVVLRVPPGQEPDRSVLKQAAAIAAYHSKARQGGVVAVSATRARYVTKPRGAKPGTVQIRKEIVLKVRPALPDASFQDKEPDP